MNQCHCISICLVLGGQWKRMECFNGNAVVTWAVHAGSSFKLFLWESFAAIVPFQKFLCDCVCRKKYAMKMLTFVWFLWDMEMQEAVYIGPLVRMGTLILCPPSTQSCNLVLSSMCPSSKSHTMFLSVKLEKVIRNQKRGCWIWNDQTELACCTEV